jgi:hypothetical protein
MDFGTHAESVHLETETMMNGQSSAEELLQEWKKMNEKRVQTHFILDHATIIMHLVRIRRTMQITLYWQLIAY